jgi:hypothetical protein
MDFRLTTPVLDQNCWPALPQSFVNEIFGKTRGQLEDLVGVIASQTTPSPADRNKLWVKLDGSDNPIGRFFYGNGVAAWVWPYDDDARKLIPGERRIWLGDPAAIPTLGGGTAGPVTLSTGPFWEIDTPLFDGRVPMGVGAIPGAVPAHSLTSGEQYGEAAHLQLADEVGPHPHPLATDTSLMNADGSVNVNNTGSTGPGLFIGLTGDFTTPLSVQNNEYTDPVAGQQKIPIIPPTVGVYFLKRTIRIFLQG